VKIQLTSTDYTLEIDGTQVADLPSTDLSNWQSGTVTLAAGDFDGWIDEIVVKRGG
jgi:hypothetical protein